VEVKEWLKTLGQSRPFITVISSPKEENLRDVKCVITKNYEMLQPMVMAGPYYIWGYVGMNKYNIDTKTWLQIMV
jgi:hypothetical protein